MIGAGSAGFSAAITAAELGAKVALIGHGMIGRTCVNVGCVPSKALIRAAEAVHGGRAAHRFPGLGGTVQLDDWAALAAAKDSLVGELRQKKYIDLLPVYDGVSYIAGQARFADGSLLVIGGGVIGVELGQMFARFGVAITICCRSRLLPELYPEVSIALQTYLEAEGVIVRTGLSCLKIERRDHFALLATGFIG